MRSLSLKANKGKLGVLATAVAVCCICLAIYIKYGYGDNLKPKDSNGPVFKVSCMTSELEESTDNGSYELRLTITNISSKTAWLRDCRPTCRCTTAHSASARVGPGESYILPLRMHMERQSWIDEGDLFLKQFNEGLELVYHLEGDSSAGVTSQSVPLTGTIRRDLSIAASHYIGTHSELSSMLPHVNIKIRSVKGLQSLSGFALDPIIQVKTVGPVAVTDAFHEYSAEVSFTKMPLKGAISSRIEFSATDFSGKLLARRRAVIIGEIVEDIVPRPSEIVLPAKKLGETAGGQAEIVSLSGGSVKVIDLKVNGEGLTASGGKESPTSVFVTQEHRKAGQHVGSVIANVASNNRMYSVVIPVISYGY